MDLPVPSALVPGHKSQAERMLEDSVIVENT